MKRRDFLFGAVGTGAMASTNPVLRRSNETRTAFPKIKEYRTLGRTGFKVSDIGSGSPQEESMLNALLMQGVNYIDTAESYSDGASERLAGRVIKNFDRNKLFINTKLFLTGEENSKEIKSRALKCLERLNSEYIDCLMIHQASSRISVKNKAFHQATSQLKQEGKLRFVGISCHGTNWRDEPEDAMDSVLGAAIDDGRFDVMLLVYNYLQRDMGQRILRDCREKNIGTTLMKTDPFGPGAFTIYNDRYTEQEKQGREIPDWMKELRLKYDKYRKQARPFLEKHNLTSPGQIRDAAIRFVLDNPNVNSAVITFRNFDDVNNYLRLSGSRFSKADESNLQAHADTKGHLYCRHACGVCESECPSRVPVNTIMRYNHYFVTQGREKRALRLYYELEGPKADKCMNCDGPCQAACPFGVAIHDLLKYAHSNLTLA